MNVLEGSLACRAVSPAWRWLSAAVRNSLVGHFFVVLARVVTALASDSVSLGTGSVRSRKFARAGHPFTLLLISRPYLWLRGVVGGGPLGRVARAADAQIARSRLAGGAWLTVLGAGIFALGCGRLGLLAAERMTTVDNTGIPLAAPGLRLVTPVLVLVVGGLLLATGPRLVAAFSGSLAGRGTALVAGGAFGPWQSSPGTRTREAGPRGKWFVAVAAGLAAVAGGAAGLTFGSGPALLVLVVLVACAAAVVIFRPEAMLLAVAAFPWLDWIARRALGGAGPLWDEALLIISACLLLWCVVVLRRWELWTLPLTLPLILAFTVAFGSVVINEVPGDVGFYALRILFEPLLFFFLAFLFPKDKRWVQAAIAIFVLTGTALALHGLYQYVTGAPLPASWIDIRESGIGTRAYSIIQNPNGLGAFLLLGGLTSLSLALASGLRRSTRLLWATGCVIHLAGIAVTFSRGAWLGLAAGIIALAVMAYRRYLVAIVAVAVVGWFAAPRAFIDRLTFAFSPAYITKSSEAGRLHVWRMAIDYASQHPWLGLGLGTFGGTTAVTFGYGRLWVDSFYLQLAAEGGFILLALFLWLLLRAAKGLVRGHGKMSDPYLRALAAGAFAAFSAVAVANATATVWETLTVGVGFWFLAGIVTSATLHDDVIPSGELGHDGRTG